MAVTARPTGNDAREQAALAAVAEAARTVVVIEDCYRDLPPDLRPGSLEAFRPKHREAMNNLRAALSLLSEAGQEDNCG